MAAVRTVQPGITYQMSLPGFLPGPDGHLLFWHVVNMAQWPVSPVGDGAAPSPWTRLQGSCPGGQDEDCGVLGDQAWCPGARSGAGSWAPT